MLPLKLNRKDEKLIKQYAASKGISVSTFIRQTVIEHIEDELDRKSYVESMAEHKKNPITYSMEEIKKLLDL